MEKIYILLMIIFSFFLSSCYDDLGNYDYNESVNEMQVEVEQIYNAKTVDTLIIIRPVITQTQYKDNSNLKFAWTINSTSTMVVGDTVSKSDTLAIRIDRQDPNLSSKYFIRFYIDNTENGGKLLYSITLNVAKPYDGCWTVLHTQDNMAKLGTVEYVGNEMFVTNDAYFQGQGRSLKGNAVKLGVRHLDLTSSFYNSYWKFSTRSVFFCFTDNPEESGILRQDRYFELYGNMERIIYPGDYGNFDLTKVQYVGEGGYHFGGILISNGQVFQGSGAGPRMYGMNTSVSAGGPVNITHAYAAPHIHLLYDALGKRFLYAITMTNSYYYWPFESGDSKQTMQLIPKSALSVPDVKLENISEEQEIVYMGAGYQYGATEMTPLQQQSIYVFAKEKTTGLSRIYDFAAIGITNPAGIAPLRNYFTIKTPQGVTNETPMASSYKYNRLLFYAVENRIYQLDFGIENGHSQLIYEHPVSSARVAVMSMARGANSDVEYSNCDDIYQNLGIAFNLSDGTGELVILNLNNAGKVGEGNKFPAIQCHSLDNQNKPFGTIKDIVFI